MNEVLQAALFAFAIQAGGYTEFCQTRECKPAPVSYDVSRVIGSGAYINGVAHVRYQTELRARITYVHEQIHHLQRLSGRFPYKGQCNMWGAEREAYKGGAAYARSQGATEEWIKSYLSNAEKTAGNSHSVKSHAEVCKAAVERGLLIKPKWFDEAVKDLPL